MTMKSPLQGQMALKSSVYNASNGKLCAQHLTIDHMNAHYKKLLNAKSAIDASMPKSYQSSQKVRDRKMREELMKGEKVPRPSSARSISRSKGMDGIGETNMDFASGNNFTEDEINCINAMVKETMQSTRLEDGRKSSRSGSGGLKSSRGAVEALSKDTQARKIMSADILEKRNHAFSEPSEQFTPRLLKTTKYNVQSRLSQSKTYRPAKRAGPPPAGGQRAWQQADQRSESTDMLDETLMSRDFNTRISMSGTVPPLDISIDKDHLKWLQDQSVRRETSKRTSHAQDLHHTSEAKSKQKPLPSGAGTVKSTTIRQIQQEEEELKYLNFITDVTNDILTRGIFTNRVLRNVFEQHIEKTKKFLNESRMRSMLDGLREDLGIPAVDTIAGADDVGMGSIRPLPRSRTSVTGYTGAPTQFRQVNSDFGTEFLHASRGSANQQRQDILPPTAGSELSILDDIVELSEKASGSYTSSVSRPARNADLAQKSAQNGDDLSDVIADGTRIGTVWKADRQNGLDIESVTPRTEQSLKSEASHHTAEKSSQLSYVSQRTSDKLSQHSIVSQRNSQLSLRSAASERSAAKVSQLDGDLVDGSDKQPILNLQGQPAKDVPAMPLDSPLREDDKSSHHSDVSNKSARSIRKNPEQHNGNRDVIGNKSAYQQVSVQQSGSSESNRPVINEAQPVPNLEPVAVTKENLGFNTINNSSCEDGLDGVTGTQNYNEKNRASASSQSKSPLATPRSSCASESEGSQEDDHLDSYREFSQTTVFDKTIVPGNTPGKSKPFARGDQDEDNYSDEDFAEDEDDF